MSRLEKLRQIFSQNNIEALFVSNFYNIFYLTGFKTLTDDEREAYVLVTKKNIYLFTDARYLNKNSKLKSQNSKLTTNLIEPDKGVLAHLKEIIEKEKINLLGVEAEDLRLSEYHKLQKVFLGLKIVPTEKLLVKLREIKEKEEIQKIKKACEIADNCLKDIVKIIKVGMSEKYLAFKIESWLKEKGYDTAFYPIVAVDKNCAIAHYSAKDGETKIKKNSIVLLDFGAKFKDYVSDMTRMIFLNPREEMLNIYNVLLSIQEKTIKKVGETTSPKEIDTFCRNQFLEKNLPSIPHSIGHGVGLEVHEYPKIAQKSTDILRPGQVFTIEPGVYFEGKWGMRIEDTVWINNNLKPEILTKFNKQPLILK